MEGDLGRKPKAGKSARDADAFKAVLTRINSEGWRALKVLAVERETTLNALAVEAFNDLLRKHGKRWRRSAAKDGSHQRTT